MMSLNKKYYISINLLLSTLCGGFAIYQFYHHHIASALTLTCILFINSVNSYKNRDNIETGSLVLLTLSIFYVLTLYFTVTTDYLGAPWLFQIVLYSYSLAGLKKGIIMCTAFFTSLVSIHLAYFILEIPFPYSLTYTFSYALALVVLSVGVFFYAYNVEQLTKERDEKQRLLINALNEIKQAQNKLVEVEKMAVLGHLVTGVAHQLNTPIGNSLTGSSFINDEAKLMLKRFNMESISKKSLNDFLDNTIQMSKKICNSLLEASKIISTFKLLSLNEHNEEKKVFDIKNHLISHVITSNLRENNPLIEFEFHFEENIKVYSYAETLCKTLQTLIENSLKHAFDEGKNGIITITIHKDEKSLKIKYQDNGKGIEKKVLDNMFTPFYTSKMANNRGLGLSILYTLIHHKMHADLTCNSTLGEGMTVLVTIPLSELAIPDNKKTI